ncbi:MAG: T9SS type A sorting domain-containing protein [Ignavibacteriales bacterium]|nr:T9SS type A sorting domain-containing protein [Ignavibacteriales bacterium]
MIRRTMFSLEQNYPNPFNPSTEIQFSLPQKRHVTLTIFDLLGREVVTLVSEEWSAGSYCTGWDAGRMSSGVYLCRLQAGDFVETKKLLLLR